MIIALVCFNCDEQFGVERVYAKSSGNKARVRINFVCPYCQRKYKVGDELELAGISGGVNIVGRGKLSVGGDIVGGDKIGG